MNTYKEIISLAVNNEVEAYQFYKSVAEKTQDSNLKSIFQELAKEEQQHKDFLEGLLSEGAADLFFEKVSDYRVSTGVEKPKLSMDMKPVDAIALAMKREEEAMELYSEMAEKSQDPEKKKMFQELSKMEQGHKVKLEEIFTNMAFTEIW